MRFEASLRDAELRALNLHFLFNCLNNSRSLIAEDGERAPKCDVPKTLNYLETRLDPSAFFRVSRQHIVNLQWIKDVQPWFSGSLRLLLKSGQEIEVSSRQAQRFREIMSL